MSLFAIRDGKLKQVNETSCHNITVTVDWASKANYNNPLFTIYHTLQFAKHKGMYWGRQKKFTDYYGHECENTFGMPLVHHRAELAPGMLKMGLFLVFVTPCHIAKFCLHVLSHRHVLSPRYKTLRKIHSVHGLSLFSSNIVIHLSSSLDVCIGVREGTGALCCVVFYYPRFR